MQTAAVVGASGLVGRQILIQLESLIPQASARAWVRRETVLPGKTAGLVSKVIPAPEHDFWKSDCLFVALGTTLGKAGSQNAFRAIDFAMVSECARSARLAGATTLALVSATGANPYSRVFYNRVKGETETAVNSMGFPRVVIVRPSLLLGKRKEFRLGELLARKTVGTVRWAIPKSIRPVRDSEVAWALVKAVANSGWSGVRILENADLLV